MQILEKGSSVCDPEAVRIQYEMHLKGGSVPMVSKDSQMKD